MRYHLFQGLPPPDPRFSFPGAAAPGPRHFLLTTCPALVHTVVRASGCQWWPVVARGGQLVPEGARGCQGGLASTGHHWPPVATSGDQWRCSSVGPVRTYLYAPAVASGGQLKPDPPGTLWHLLVPTGHLWPSLATTGHRWRVRVRTSAHRGAAPLVATGGHWWPVVAS